MRARTLLERIGALVTVPALTAACGATCDRNPDAEGTRYTDGATDVEAQFYETAGWTEAWLDFPGGKAYLLEHGLAGPPAEIIIWLAFEETPIPNSNAALAAGNQAIIENVTDELIRIRNDTCSDFFLRVTASNPETPDAPDGG